MRDRINIKKAMCPYTFNIVLANKLYNIRVDYNATSDSFTVTLKYDNKTICTEPLVYGVPLFQDIYQPGIHPMLNIIPYDESGEQKEVNFKTLNETVFLTIDNQG